MSDASHQPAPAIVASGSALGEKPHAPGRFSLIGPLALWLSLQLLALSAAAFRVPFWAEQPAHGETLALHFLLFTQILASAMLFPVLLKDAFHTIAIACTTLPFAQLAWSITSVHPPQAAIATGYVIAWLGCLSIWPHALRTHRMKAIGLAVLTAMVLAGPLLGYLRLEFASEEGHSLGPTSPLEVVNAMLTETAISWKPFAHLAIFAALGITGICLHRFRARQKSASI